MQCYFETQAEAADALNEMLYAFKRGTLITKKDQTLGQHLEHWLESLLVLCCQITVNYAFLYERESLWLLQCNRLVYHPCAL